MPIRMTDDPQQPNNNDYDDNSGGRRNPSGGGLFALLPLLFSLFKGKRSLLLIVIAAVAWFAMGKGDGGCNNLNIGDVAQQLFSKSGYSYSPEEFNKAAIYEGLEDDNQKTPLPEAVSLLRFASRRGDQGAQGSCVAWSSACVAQTILKAAATGQNPDEIAFSPSYLYNQVRLGDDCQGSYIQRAMQAMKTNGGVTLTQYPYSDQDCSRTPDGTTLQAGKQNTIHGFTRLTDGDNLNQISIRAIKEHLYKDAPVVIGMMVGQSFMQDMTGKELWQPQGMDQSQVGLGGRAMCVIGYDDSKYGGAFQIMNSRTPQWGKNGIAWVRYPDFRSFVREAYDMDSLPKSASVVALPLECTIGLVDNATKHCIRLKSAGSNQFETIRPIKVGTRFKMEIKNSTEYYIYIFGQETDGKSFVLFSYLKPGETISKHAPYCGITGYRLFPKNQSLEADAIENKDYMAIVISKKELDYTKLNEAINSSTQSTFEQRVNRALQSIAQLAVQSATAEGALFFKADAQDNPAIIGIVSLDKQS